MKGQPFSNEKAQVVQWPKTGSAAAWLQRAFWGGAVARGSWFAILQSLGMTLAGGWVEKVAVGTGLAAILKFATKS